MKKNTTSIRSVVGTVDIPEDDPDLERAKASMRAEFELSLTRSMLMQKGKAASHTARRSKRPRRAPEK